MSLTPAQESTFIADGYVLLPGLVPMELITAALQAINRDLGSGIDPRLIPGYLAQTFCPAIASSGPILDLLLRSPALDLLQSALGARIRPPAGAQIALRFPGYGLSGTLSAPHLDGIPDRAGANGVPQQTIGSFTALVYVLLSDVGGPWSGNFLVHPGSHRAIAAWLRTHGCASLLGGLPPIGLAPPRQITGRAGDVVIAHYQLAHGVAANDGAQIRYACFFRTEVEDLDQHREASLLDPWRDWQGLRHAHPAP